VLRPRRVASQRARPIPHGSCRGGAGCGSCTCASHPLHGPRPSRHWPRPSRHWPDSVVSMYVELPVAVPSANNVTFPSMGAAVGLVAGLLRAGGGIANAQPLRVAGTPRAVGAQTAPFLTALTPAVIPAAVMPPAVTAKASLAACGGCKFGRAIRPLRIPATAVVAASQRPIRCAGTGERAHHARCSRTTVAALARAAGPPTVARSCALAWQGRKGQQRQQLFAARVVTIGLRVAGQRLAQLYELLSPASTVGGA
jgi:hypothetical protein